VRVSEGEMADVRAIALIRLARDFQRTYKRWLETWVELKGCEKAKKLLEELKNDTQCRGWKLSEDVMKEVEGEIAALDFHIKEHLQRELCRHYADLQRLEREIPKVLDWPWDWRDGSESDAIWASKRCSDLE